MRVLITGGAGHVGKAMTQRFVDHGWDVEVIGIEPKAEVQGANYTQCDILNYAALRDVMRGCEAVVHLAAIPCANLMSGSATFSINAAGTFNVFEAAEAQGIKRIVQASSINAIGAAWGLVDINPAYLPMDEAHTTYTTDPYSFSKQMVEEIGAYYWRRAGITSVALRFPYVYPASTLHSEDFQTERGELTAALDAFQQLPQETQQAQFHAMRERVLHFRQRRSMEQQGDWQTLFTEYPLEDWLWRICLFDRFDLWAYIDERDAAQAAEKALTATFEGSHVLFVNAANNRLNYDSQTLARIFYPGVQTYKQAIVGTQSLVSIEKARRLIGFEPDYSVY